MNEADGLRLHHIGHAVREIDSAAQSYVLGFGYQVVTATIHDPLQTAFVRFLQLPGELTYLEVVAPDNDASKLANVARRGGGLHHLCYSAGSLECAIDHFEGTGMKLISDPKPAAAFSGRRICWLLSAEQLLLELLERRDEQDTCVPG